MADGDREARSDMMLRTGGGGCGRGEGRKPGSGGGKCRPRSLRSRPTQPAAGEGAWLPLQAVGGLAVALALSSGGPEDPNGQRPARQRVGEEDPGTSPPGSGTTIFKRGCISTIFEKTWVAAISPQATEPRPGQPLSPTKTQTGFPGFGDPQAQERRMDSRTDGPVNLWILTHVCWELQLQMERLMHHKAEGHPQAGGTKREAQISGVWWAGEGSRQPGPTMPACRHSVRRQAQARAAPQPSGSARSGLRQAGRGSCREAAGWRWGGSGPEGTPAPVISRTLRWQPPLSAQDRPGLDRTLQNRTGPVGGEQGGPRQAPPPPTPRPHSLPGLERPPRRTNRLYWVRNPRKLRPSGGNPMPSAAGRVGSGQSSPAGATGPVLALPLPNQ
ncbi:proline-rich protein 2-like [Tachyglossus aculeatus]|uniref:proline-rich protein 2-like n=1 Tax=Tachyglossus aculeatus TaxID=9261 RepID=UPI0018F2DAE4|nr:proline-rich protein 2-like [Tachyglossus aculeatus]